jgi:hypothetical protein
MCQLRTSAIWDHVESYAIRMLLTRRLRITFTPSLKLIISFLVSTHYYLSPSLDSHSSVVRVGMLLFLFLLCCISRLGPRGLLNGGVGSGDGGGNGCGGTLGNLLLVNDATIVLMTFLTRLTTLTPLRWLRWDNCLWHVRREKGWATTEGHLTSSLVAVVMD